MRGPERCAGASTRFHIPARPATRRGRPTRGPTAGAPTTGPAWPSTRHPAACSCRRDPQPLPTRPAPFARQRLTEQMLTSRTPQAHQSALEAFRTFRSDGPFVPLSVGTQTIIFPGFDGGAEWGGSAFDPESGLLYVNANEMVWTASLAENTAENSGRHLYATQCGTCHRDDLTGTPPQIPSLMDLRGKRTPRQVSA